MFGVEYFVGINFAEFLLVKLHLSLDVPIEDHMFKGEFVLSQDSLLEVWELLLVLYLKGVYFVHELQLLQVERGRLLILFEEDLLLVFEELVVGDMLLDEAVE